MQRELLIRSNREAVNVDAEPASCEPTEVAQQALSMGNETFRGFYEQTARSLWLYLRRILGDPSLADDLLQEAYIRLLGAVLRPAEEKYSKKYLFRIATNLARDHFRSRRRHVFVDLSQVTAKGSFSNIAGGPSKPELSKGEGHAQDIELESDIKRILLELSERERKMLWLAYAEGFQHEEIAEIIGCKPASVRPMLFRARQRLARILRSRGWKSKQKGETK